MATEKKTETIVSVIPNCDICREKGVTTPAFADASLRGMLISSWASVCRKHFDEYKCQLGMGCGQKYVLRTEPEKSQDERIKENMRGIDWETMTLDDFDEIFEDRDPFEFM